MTHLLKLVDKICKYEIDLASIVEDTDQTWFGGWMDNGRTKWYHYNWLNFIDGVYNNMGADTLAPYIIRSSVTNELIPQNI